ncbi:hypothetical protein PG993_005732 [Apiospora rasikravindrae]|uniref:Transmembrane protein n=1 Tax=Apiospora rasikravindrae TaxID=990691 RepID=A0ABR1T9M5_9PEZI
MLPIRPAERSNGNARCDYENGVTQNIEPDPDIAGIGIITALSDLQLFTGLSLLICGFSIAQDGMLGYHWKIITRLAWFSTITHLAALSIWHRQPHKPTLKRVLRLILMSCLAIMLLAALMVTADSGFRDDYYAVCYMRVPRPHFNVANPDTIQPGRHGADPVRQKSDIANSCEWGTLRLLELRTKGPPGEDDWSFGQIFPLAMFIAPVFIVIHNMGRSGANQGPSEMSAAQNVVPPPVTYFGWREQQSTNRQSPLPTRRLLYVEKLSSSLISVLGPLTPSPQDANVSTIVAQWGSSPPRHEPFFLGRYESWSCFGDLVWQLCLWILSATFFLVLNNLDQFAPIVKLLPDIPLFPTEQDPLENILVDNQYDQSPFYAFVVLLGWLLLFQPVSSILSIILLSSRWLDRRSHSRRGRLVRIMAVLCSIAAPTLTDIYCNLIQAALAYTGIVAVYVVLCAGLSFSLVGSGELEDWKRLSAEAETRSAAGP